MTKDEKELGIRHPLFDARPIEIKAKISSRRGGKRNGSGRKATEKISIRIRLTPETLGLVNQFVWFERSYKRRTSRSNIIEMAILDRLDPSRRAKNGKID